MEEEKKTAEKAAEKKIDDKTADESGKEDLKDSEIIDINKKTDSEDDAAKGGKNTEKKNGKVTRKSSPKSTEDFIENQKKRKRTKRIVTLVIIVAIIIAIVLWVKNAVNKTKQAFSDLTSNNVQTSHVEKKTLYDSKNATGTLYALESRTISRSLQGSGQGGADIVAVNVEVGDHVEEGDILVEFSSENIEKSIAQAKEDIGTQKKLDAISAEDAQRNYVYQYSSAATNMQNTAKSVDRALEALYEACDAYGDAKRARDEAKKKAEEEGRDWELIKGSYENAVSQAYQAEQRAQQTYDDAVEAQAAGGQGGVASVSNSLSTADSEYKRAQINSGEQVKKLTRQLNDSIDSLDDYVVHATISGVVTEVNVSEGNTFGSGSVLTIQDDSGFKADVLVDEYDIPKVKKAYNQKKAAGEQLEVVVKTDATGDNEYKGHVTKIAPTSTATTAVSVTATANSNGITSTASTTSTANYKVSIELDDIDESFMIGMSAKVAIVVDESPENSLCVPYNCVEERDGKYYVRVMDEKGDKSTADNFKPQGMNGMPGMAGDGQGMEDDTDSKGVNGIVIENDTDESRGRNRGRSGKNNKKGFFDKIFGNKKEEDIQVGRKYREEEVDKIFDTDYYAAVVPKRDGGVKEGDEVMVVTEKSSGNDLMMMFGPGGGF